MVLEVSLLCFLPRLVFIYFSQTENLENGNAGERKSNTEQNPEFCSEAFVTLH